MMRWAAHTLLTAALYFAAAKFALVFAIPPGFASAVWPPAGIALAALMLGGLRLWPGIWLGSVAANLTVQLSFAAPFAIGVGGALEALFCAWGASRFIGRPEALFKSANNVFRLVGLALAGAAISASIANAALGLAGVLTAETWFLNWLTWWLGDAMGIILLTPLILAFAARTGERLSPPRIVELVLAALAMLAITGVVFFENLPAWDSRAVTFILLPPLIWIAARFGPREMASAAALSSALAMLATVLGRGPFVAASLNESLLLQQAFVCTIAVVGLSLTVATHELRRAREEIEELVDLASHDLQEPVRNMLGYTELLRERYGERLGEDGREFLGFMAAGARRMRKLIDDLLLLSRAGRARLSLRPADSAVALAEARANLSAAISESGAEITHDALPTVMADPVLLSQVLQNLLGNAIKFCGAERPRIHVSARRAGGRWILAVRDHGIGIAPQHQEKIFGMFERLHPRAQGGGSGVGLALCRRIVDRHGGRMWVESAPSQGATFLFTLPGVDGER